MWLRMFLTRFRIWWRGKPALHRGIVVALMFSFVIYAALFLFLPPFVSGCAANILLWFALFVIGTIPKEIF